MNQLKNFKSLNNPYNMVHNEHEGEVLLLGRPSIVQPSPEQREALAQLQIERPAVMNVHKKMVWKGKVYHSRRRDDSTVMLTDGVYGSILKISSFANGHNEVILFVQPFVIYEEPILTDNRSNASIPHIVQVLRSNHVIAAKLVDVAKKCLLLDMQPCFICCLPNFHERD